MLACLLGLASWGTGQAQNVGPSISGVPSTSSTAEDTPKVITFSVADNEDDNATLTVTATSNASAVVASNSTGLSITKGSGGERTLTITPQQDASGSAEITLTVRDSGNATASAKIMLTVTAVNDLPVISAISDGQSTNEDQAKAINFTVTDVETSDDAVVVVGSSSNQALVPDSGIRVTKRQGGDDRRTVTITPATNAHGGPVTITLTATDGDMGTSTETFTLSITPQPDDPEITGRSSIPSEVDDTALGDLFAGVGLLEVDGQDVTATVDLDTTMAGSIVRVSGGGNPTPVTLPWSETGSPSQVQGKLRELRYRLEKDTIAVGEYDVKVKLELEDAGGAKAAENGESTIKVISRNDSAAVTFRTSPSRIPDSRAVQPFILSVSDVDFGEEFSLRIAETTGFGTLSSTGPFVGTGAQVQAALQNVQFRPVPQGRSVTASFEVSVTELHPPKDGNPNSNPTPESNPVKATASLQIDGVNHPPEISGVSSREIRTTDDPNASVRPFSEVVVVDPDPSQRLVVTLSLDNPAEGMLSATSLEGDAATVTAGLQAVTFAATPNLHDVNELTSVRVIITVFDGSESRTNNQTVIVVTSVDGPPVLQYQGAIEFPAAPILISPDAEARPFLDVTLTDDDPQSALTLTVSLDNADKGGLRPAGSADPVVPTFSVTGNLATVQAALQSLVFEPSGTYEFPPTAPGGTTFQLSVEDPSRNRDSEELSILLQNEPRSHLVTLIDDDPARPGTLRHAVSQAGNGDSIVIALPEYPARIRLDAGEGPLVLEKDLRLLGPGADLFEISGDSTGNGVPDVQVMRVSATVEVAGMTLSDGTAATGGCVFVAPTGHLTLRECTVANGVAQQWGGGVDVGVLDGEGVDGPGGSLRAEGCLFTGNSTDPALGSGGGAVSLYTSARCVFLNSTFSGNMQGSVVGFGGGALYAENLDPRAAFAVEVLHCTFAGNSDSSAQGSAIVSNVFGTSVALSHSILADGENRNLGVQGAGRITSGGGNVSNDSTRVSLNQGGQAETVILLGHATDRILTNPLLEPLQRTTGPTPVHPLNPVSPAVSGVAAVTATTDQNGALRDIAPDAGAFEFGAFSRLVINEIHFGPDPGDPDDVPFIEIYNPRSSVEFDFKGLDVCVDGDVKFTFTDSLMVAPGGGVVVADAPITTPTPVKVLPSGSLDLGLRSLVELKRGDEVLASVDYVAVFADPTDMTPPVGDWDLDYSSITLVPQFVGHAYLPHSGAGVGPVAGFDLNTTGPASSAGADGGGTPFGLPNGFPTAFPDSYVTDEDHLLDLDVLANDFDADRLDRLEIIDPDSPAPVSNYAGTAGSAQVTVEAASHGLVAGDLVLIGGYGGAGSYNGLHEVLGSTADTFTIALSYVDNAPRKGWWAGAVRTNLGAAAAVRRDPSGTDMSVLYDPRVSVSGAGNLRELAVGESAIDSFDYEIRDVDENGAPKSPSANSTTRVSIKVLGVNDPPEPVDDVAETFEESPLTFLAASSLLDDDLDPDRDFSVEKLSVVGVVDRIFGAGGYRGTAGRSPVTVIAPSHGLESGDGILLARYGGDPSYNGYHRVTVVDQDHFALPVAFVDNDSETGWWAPLDNSNRLAATSALGANVSLEIRASRLETNVVYDPRPSAELDMLPRYLPGNPSTMAMDSFYYVVEDQHGGANFGRVSVKVKGENDGPVAQPDPDGLDTLQPVISELALDPLNPTLAEVTSILSELEIRHYAAGAQPFRSRVLVQHPESSAGAVGLSLFFTDQDTPIRIPAVGAPVASYAGAPGEAPVMVSAPGHGLVSGMRVLIDGYGGQGSYNGLHVIEVTGPDAFSIPVAFLDDHADKGRWSAEGAVVANDTDVDRDEILTVDAVTASRMGAAVGFNPPRSQVVAGMAQSISYDPTNSSSLRALAREEVVIDTFEYVIRDGAGGTTRSMVAVLVIGKNEQPEAFPDFAEADEDQPLVFNLPVVVERNGVTLPVSQIGVVANDREEDIDGAAPDNHLMLLPSLVDPVTGLAVPETTAIEGVQVVKSRDGTLIYDATNSATVQALPAGTVIADMFPYTIVDNSFVFANEDLFKVRADGSGYRLDVLRNDATLTGGKPGGSLVEGYSGVLGERGVVVAAPGHGLAHGERVLISGHQGNPSYDGIHVITFVDSDAFSIPVPFEGDEAAGRGLWKEAVEIVAVDPPNSGGVVEVVDQSGLAVDLEDPGRAPGVAIRYSPPVNFVGDETFRYAIRDSMGGSDSAFVTVRSVVEQLNGNLQVNADAYDVAAGEEVVLDVLANDDVLPADGTLLTIEEIVGLPGNGTAVLEGNLITYTPAAGFHGTDTLVYRASGGGSAVAEAVVTIEVIDRLQVLKLELRDDAFSVTSGATRNVLDVLANDEIVSGSNGALQIVGVTGAALGAVAVSEDGRQLFYTPAQGVIGEERLTYTATDNLGGTNTAQVTVSIGQLVTNCDYFTVEADAGGSYLLDVLANDGVAQAPEDDLSLDGDPVALNGASGVMVVSGTQLSYTPGAGTLGEQTFRYQVRDSSNHTASCLVTVNVISSGLVANVDRFSVLRDSAANALDVLLNDAVIPAGSTPVSIVSVGTGAGGPDQGGSVSIGPIERGGETVSGIIYQPAVGFVGEETFTYSITDGRNGTDTTTVVVSVTGGRFEANADAFTVYYEPPVPDGEPATFALPVLANDVVLPDFGAPLSIVGIGQVPDQGGSVRISEDGLSVVYTPAAPSPNGMLMEEFAYEITDGGTRRASALVTVQILDRIGIRNMDTNDDRFTVLANSNGNVLRVLENDGIKPASSAGTVITSVFGFSAGGFAAVSGQNLAYSPQPGFVGEETFQYMVSDGLGGTGTGSVTVRVGDIRITPDRFVAISGQEDVVLEVLANDDVLPGILPEGRGLEIHAADAAGSENGSVSLSGAGAGNFLRYTPDPGYTGSYPYVETFGYVVQDDSGSLFPGAVEVEVHRAGSDRSTAMVTVTINGRNDAPTLAGASARTVRDDGETDPFTGMVISELDEGGAQVLRLVVTLDRPSLGGLTGPLQRGANGYYYLEGTAAEISAALQEVRFVPEKDALAVGETGDVTLSLSVDDGFGLLLVDSNTVVTVVPVNDAPLVSGLRPLQTFYKRSVKPFVSTTIIDPDHAGEQILTVTLSLDDARTGVLSGSPEMVMMEPGVYQFVGDAEAATGVLRDLVFEPTPGLRVSQQSPETTVLRISLSDGSGAPPVEDAVEITARRAFVEKLTPEDTESMESGGVGTAVLLEGPMMVVGAPASSLDGTEAGAVFIYEAGADGRFVPTEVLVPGQGDPGDQFGASLAMFGGYLAVGAPGDDDLGQNSGSVYLFERAPDGSWNLLGKIFASNGGATDQFGASLSMDGSLLAVGAPIAGEGGFNPGAVYVFRQAPGGGAWTEEAQLMASNARGGDTFGHSVSLSGTTLAVGAPRNDESRSQVGTVYLFERDGGSWSERELLHLSVPKDDALFGSSLALVGDRLLVGAPGAYGEPKGIGSGAAFLFARDAQGWSEAARLDVPEEYQARTISFGEAVAMDAERIVIGAPMESVDGGSQDHGAVHVYEGKLGVDDAWGWTERLVDNRRVAGHRLGSSVALDFHTIVGGSPQAQREGAPDGDLAGAVLVGDMKWNNAPGALVSEASFEAVAGQPFLGRLPGGGIGEPDLPDSLFLSSDPLPGWLVFHPRAGTLSGIPPAGAQELELRITGVDEDNESASLQVRITIHPGGPYLHATVVEGVSNTGWTRVTVPRDYQSLVVVATPVYDRSAPPLVSRIRNAVSGNSFDLQVQRADGSGAPVTPVAVQVVVVEEGVYTAERHGVVMEAVRYRSTRTDGVGSWIGEEQVYRNQYERPVVLGQVMSADDSRFSVFWSGGEDRLSRPSATRLVTGKHVGEDSDASRAPETIGYIVLDEGVGRIRSVDGDRGFVAGFAHPSLAYEQDPQPRMEFREDALRDHGPASGQSRAVVLEGGNGLLVEGDGWHSLLTSQSLTESSVLEFEFLSKQEGAVHGIGFDNDALLSFGTTYQLFGQGTFGLQSFRNYPGQGAYVSYEIPVGEDLAGSFDRLVFGASGPGSHSYFRNVAVQSGTLRSYVFPRGLAGATTAVMSMQGMPSDGGGWPVLVSPLDDTDLRLAVDEDTMADAERSHVLGGVGYFVLGAAGAGPPVTVEPMHALGGYGAWLERHFEEATLRDPALEATVWGFAADADGDGLANGLEYSGDSVPTDPASLSEPFTVWRDQATGEVIVTHRHRKDDPRLVVTLETSLDGVVFDLVGAANSLRQETVPGGAFDTTTSWFAPLAGEQGPERLFRLVVRYSSGAP